MKAKKFEQQFDDDVDLKASLYLSKRKRVLSKSSIPNSFATCAVGVCPVLENVAKELPEIEKSPFARLLSKDPPR